MNSIKYVLENPAATFKKVSDGSAGYDLSVIEDVRLSPGESKLVKTGVRVAIPEGHFGLLLPKSSLSTRHNVGQVQGVIDSDYRGEILCNITNNSDSFNCSIPCGTMISQLVIIPIHNSVDSVQLEELDSTGRGDRGFGGMTDTLGRG